MASQRARRPPDRTSSIGVGARVARFGHPDRDEECIPEAVDFETDESFVGCRRSGSSNAVASDAASRPLSTSRNGVPRQSG
jgi:hypothetical protein